MIVSCVEEDELGLGVGSSGGPFVVGVVIGRLVGRFAGLTVLLVFVQC